jgi:DNA-binding MarR family transcriptional regulator
MEVIPPALADRVGYLLGRAAAQAQALTADSLNAIGITGKDYGILTLLDERPLLGQTDLGRALDIDRTTVVALLASLENRGLIVRIRQPEDRRRYAVTLTSRGQVARKRAFQALALCEARLLEPLTPRQQSALQRHLMAIVGGVQNAPVRP